MKIIRIFCSLFFLTISMTLYAQESFRVEKSGKGQPVLLFPGFACTSEVFKGITEELSKNYEVHAFTFAGFGEVPPIEFPWFPQIKADVEKYVQEKNLKSPIVIGHSMGGTLGLWLASENAAYSKLIVIDALPAMGALMMPDYKSENVVYENPYNDQLLAMDDKAFKKMAEQMASQMSVKTENHAQLVDWLIQSDRKTYVYGYTDLLKVDLREAIGKIGAPVTILAATYPYGRETAELNYQRQYQNLENYSLNFAENAGHFIMYDQPEWLLTQITTALQHNE